MKAASRVVDEMSILHYTNLEGVERNTSKYQYLVFKQSEKQELLRHKYTNVLTIHEYQGKQADHIMVVRTSHKKEAIYDSDSHCLVAISRHRKSFTTTYVTPVSTDGISKYVHKSKTYSRQDMEKRMHSLGGGSLYCWRSRAFRR